MTAYLRRSRDFSRVVVQVAVMMIVVVAGYAVLWAAVGFNPIRAFQTARSQQAALMRMMNQIWASSGMQRHYPSTILGDLQEFAFGMSWVPLVLAIGWLSRVRSVDPAIRTTAIAGLALPPIVAISGLLPAETARVWIFVMPVVVLAAALEITEWSVRKRLIIHIATVLCAIAVYSNAGFVLSGM